MKKTIGMCDSGIGGILVVNALVEAYPNLNIVYIGDQKNAPYGDCSKDELMTYAVSMMNEFKRRNIDQVIIACNTLCANVLKEIQEQFRDMDIVGVLEPTCRQIKEDIQSLLVIATTSTINKHAFQTYLNASNPDLTVYELACPELVPLIEGGADNALLQQRAKDYVAPYLGKVDAVIMGCTHFPLVEESIQHFLGVKTFNSNEAMVHEFSFHQEDDEGEISIFTSKDAISMKEKIKCLIQKDWDVQEIDLES